MSEPLILCICPTRDRPGYVDRIQAMFWRQSYERCCLMILETGCTEHYINAPRTTLLHQPQMNGQTVGALRNHMIEQADWPKVWGKPEFIAHWDHDDYSAPDRLSRQLAHIEKTGKLVTGFYDMPMYETIHDKVYMYRNSHTNYALGTSLFYRREAWERVKFPDETPEDNKWRRLVGFDNCESQSSLREDGSPIMIQVIHGGNASARIIRGGTYFKEADEAQAKAVRGILASA